MSPPLIEFQTVSKSYPALRPLRVAAFSCGAADRVAIRGLDKDAAEMFIHLITGAAVPDEGVVRIAGRDTREIATDTEWLTSLDRFGIVTNRAVLIDKLTLAQNLALPLTLSIEPIPSDVVQRVKEEAAGVSLPMDWLDRPVSELGEEHRTRVHLARAVANRPECVLLEHPTARFTSADESTRFGDALRRLSDARGFGWLAISEDKAFADASGGTQLEFNGARGQIAPAKRGLRSWFT